VGEEEIAAMITLSVANTQATGFVSPKAGRLTPNNNNTAITTTTTTTTISQANNATFGAAPTPLQAGQKLKVMTYNVHGWEDADGADNFDRVAELLLQQRPDVICLQEVKEESRKYPMGGTLEALAAKLKMDFVKAVAASPDPSQWTPELDVVLSRFPILSKHTTKLLVGRHQERVAAIAEFKFEVISSTTTTTTIDNSMQRRVAVVCTHLDHAFEKVRLAQLAQLHDFLKRLDLKEYVLAGDFNSVCKDDFLMQDWDALTQLRRRNCWEPPLNDVLQTLFDHGYRDSYWEHQKRRYRKQFSLPSSSSISFESSSSLMEMIPKPQSTCWANTRIDYVLLSRELKMKPHSYARVYNRASDHFPVVIELKL